MFIEILRKMNNPARPPNSIHVVFKIVPKPVIFLGWASLASKLS